MCYVYLNNLIEIFKCRPLALDVLEICLCSFQSYSMYMYVYLKNDKYTSIIHFSWEINKNRIIFKGLKSFRMDFKKDDI